MADPPSSGKLAPEPAEQPNPAHDDEVENAEAVIDWVAGREEAQSEDEYADEELALGIDRYTRENLHQTLKMVNIRISELENSGRIMCSRPIQMKLFSFGEAPKTFPAKSTAKSPAFKGFLTVSGKPFSNPKAEDFAKVYAQDETMFHMAQLLYPKEDYSCLRIAQCMKAVDTEKPIARIDIWCKDIQEIRCHLLSDDEALREANVFVEGVKRVIGIVFRVRITAAKASSAIPYLTHRALRRLGKKNSDMLHGLREALDTQAESGISLELLVTVFDRRDALELVRMCSGVELFRVKDRDEDPLARYFVRAPITRTLDPSQAVLPSHHSNSRDESHPIQGQSGVTRWASKHQQLVHQVYATTHVHFSELKRGEHLGSISFSAFAVSRSPLDGDTTFLLFVHPGPNGIFLPRAGELSKVASTAFWFVTELDDDDETDPAAVQQLTARRHDLPLAPANSVFYVYLVTKPRQVQTVNGRAAVNVRVPMAKLRPREDMDALVARVRRDPRGLRFNVVFHTCPSAKTMKTEARAVNRLAYPPSSEEPVGASSLRAYRYLVDFEADANETVDLCDAIPGIGNVARAGGADPEARPHAPAFVFEKFTALDEIAKEIVKTFAHLPHGVALIGGVAGCGKSTLLRTVTLAAQYGHLPVESTVDAAPKPDVSVLYVVNNNDGVDEYASQLVAMYESLGFGANAPQVLRLYSMESEVQSMMHRGKSTDTDPFDSESASDHRTSLSDMFLAERSAVNAAVDIDSSRVPAAQRKQKLRPMSLHSAASRFLDESKPEEWAELAKIMKRMESGEMLAVAEMEALQAQVKRLYEVFLQQFTGVVCATPVACANPALCQSFSPGLVMVDDASLLRELALLIPVAWYSPRAFIIAGDVQQLQPHVGLDEDVEVPFKESLKTSTLQRAVEAGAVTRYLTVNFRQFGDLYRLPSELCYLGQMTSFLLPGQRFPPHVKAWVRFLQNQVHEKHPVNKCRLLVELPGSRTELVGTSQANRMHVLWVMGLLKRILADPALVKPGNDKPAGVLILALYKAQCSAYRLAIDNLKRAGKYSAQAMERIRVHTLDSSQGAEDDIVIVDTTRTDRPGFCGDLQRLCVLLTRAQLGQVIVMDKGMWLAPSPHTAELAYNLRRIESYHASEDCKVTVRCCDRCETFGHKSIDCPAGRRKDGAAEVCRVHGCGRAGHTSETCPTRKCYNCAGFGHEANECTEKPACPNCGSLLHRVCSRPPRHRGGRCQSCYSVAHETAECMQRGVGQ